MMAVEFLDLAENRLKLLNESINNKFLEILLHGTFKNLVEFVETNEDVLNENKLQVSHKELNIQPVESKLQYWVNKTASSCNNFYETQSKEMNNDEQLKFELNLLWKYDTLKCIDATVMYIETTDNEELVFIGSHSSLFACIDVKSGLERWKFNAEDRIESSACVSKCGKFVIFGTIEKLSAKINFQRVQFYLRKL